MIPLNQLLVEKIIIFKFFDYTKKTTEKRKPFKPNNFSSFVQIFLAGGFLVGTLVSLGVE